MVGGRTGWTVSRFTNAQRRTGPPAGKRGMVRVGGSASRTISDSNTPDPGGGHHPAWKRPKDDTHGPRWTPNAHGFPVLGSLTPAEKDCRDRAVPDRAVPDRASAVVEKNSNLDPLWRPEWDGSHQALGRSVRAPRRRLRPAGNSGSARRVMPGRENDATRRSAVRPLSVEAVEFSPALAPEQGRGGGVGVTFTAVAEVHMSASVNEEDKLIAQASGQHFVCDTDPGKVPAILMLPRSSISQRCTGTVPRPLPVALPGVVSESQQSVDPTRMDRPENTGSRPESGKRL